MRLFLTFVMILIFSIAGMLDSFPTAASELNLNAGSAILLDYTTGQILYGKNAFVRRPPASTTKILTSIIAIEKGNLQQTVTASKTAARADGSSIYLRAGETHSLAELLYGILLNSGNDASIAVAENLAGSELKFAEWMTAKAGQIGAVDSHFRNCNGLPAKDHYSTAYDLAIIARYALRNPVFADMVKTKRKLIQWPGNSGERILINHNKLLWRYPYADGVKTGYTEEAGGCLVSSASKAGHRLIAVVLKSKDIYGDSTKLFDYGFDNYQLLTTVTPFRTSMKINIAEAYLPQVPLALHRVINPVIYARAPQKNTKKPN
jgi:D-alanyl-D-alanine carboxypeptidase (penicillin-binding protein 5/6)